MSAPLLTTKLYIPTTRSDAVPRPRLTELLDQGLARKLTLIAAPAGFGKTTLIADWLASLSSELPRPELTLNSQLLTLNFRVAWLSLDADDNDPVHLLTYLSAALQTVDPAIGRAMLAF